MTITKAILMGVYLPIGVLSACAAWLLLMRLVVPAWRDGRIKAGSVAIGLGAFLAMTAHLFENTQYGVGRWIEGMRWLLIEPPLALVGKVFILAGAILTLGGLSAAETNAAHLGRIAAVAVALWIVGTVVAVVLL